MSARPLLPAFPDAAQRKFSARVQELLGHRDELERPLHHSVPNRRYPQDADFASAL